MVVSGVSSESEGAPILQLRQLGRKFGDVNALSSVDLDVRGGELFTLLGPSGCGKTTTLRLVAGLEYPDDGQIWFDNRLIADAMQKIAVPPHRRNMGMVFQSYAVWPHMTVFENIAYPLRARRTPREIVNRQVMQALKQVDLSDLANRPGTALSGGQQQRVAMARALVYEPKLLLLDEPFSNLDAKLRDQMRLEIKKLLKGLDITVLLVTHDQFEALGMSDRIAVMNGGGIEQIGSAIDVYENPCNSFVRDFLGRVVLLRGSIAEAPVNGKMRATLFPDAPDSNVGPFWIDKVTADGLNVGQNVVVAIRPEHISVSPFNGKLNGAAGERKNLTVGTIETLMFAGDRYEARFRAGNSAFVGYVPKGESWHEGQQVVLNFPPKELSVWSA